MPGPRVPMETFLLRRSARPLSRASTRAPSARAARTTPAGSAARAGGPSSTPAVDAAAGRG
eukprot:8108394-Alexandrium_andersonii.AAC.1